MSKLIISIHGVGNEQPGRLLEISKTNFSEFESKEIVWNNYAKIFYDGIFDRIRGHFKSCYTVSNSNFSNVTNVSQKISSFFNYILQLLAYLTPLVIFCNILYILTIKIYPENATSYNNLFRPIVLFIDSICAPTYIAHYLSSVIFSFWFLLLFFVLVFFVSCIFSFGRSDGMRFFLKSVLLKFVPNIIFIPIIILFILLVSCVLFIVLSFGDIGDSVIGKLRKSSFYPELFAFIAGILFILALFVVFRFLYNKFFRSIVKVTLDIFLYISNNRYRQGIQDYINSELEKECTLEDKEVVIVSHSFGTLIIVDALINGKELKTAASIRLITMGSPLNKFFNRYFPSLFSTTQLFQKLSYLYRNNFSWINIFRPNDPVGTSLNTEGITDINTAQYEKKFVFAHVSYWNDAKVVDLIKTQLNNTHTNSTLVFNSGFIEPLFHIPQNSKYFSKINSSKNIIKYSIASLFALIALLNHALLFDNDTNKRIAHKEHIVSQYGKKYKAQILMAKMEVIDPALRDNWYGDRTYPYVVFINFKTNDTIDFIDELLYIKLDSTLLYLMGWATIDKPQLKEDMFKYLEKKGGIDVVNSAESIIENNPITGINFQKHTNYSWSKRDKFSMVLQFLDLKKMYKENGIDFEKDIYVMFPGNPNSKDYVSPRIIVPGYSFKHRFSFSLFISGLIISLIVYFLVFKVIIKLNLDDTD